MSRPFVPKMTGRSLAPLTAPAFLSPGMSAQDEAPEAARLGEVRLPPVERKTWWFTDLPAIAWRDAPGTVESQEEE